MEQRSHQLAQRLRDRQERYSPIGPKPQGLPFKETVVRLVEYLHEARKIQLAVAFGNEVGAGLEDASDRRFDPIALYADNPDVLDDIQRLVEFELSTNEADLLDRRTDSVFAYNTLVFGAAIKLARGEALSQGLSEFIIDHLIAPKPPIPPKGRGRPKKTKDSDRIRVSAIAFAAAHGLTPTRNEATVEKRSACDAVAGAAQILHQSHGLQDYATGWSYENLRKLWQSSR